MSKIAKSVEHVKKHLLENEFMKDFVYGTFEGKVHGHEILKKGLLVATNKRLLFLSRGLFGLSERLVVMPYDKITAVSYGSGFMGEKITIKASGETVDLKWISDGDALEFNRLVNKLISK